MSDLSGNELIVPPPLSRMQTKKNPENISQILTVCGNALKHFGNQPICAGNVLHLVNITMKSVFKIKKLDDDERKKLVLDSIQWMIENQKGLTDEEKAILDMMAETVFHQVVDLLSESKGCACFSK
jgi:hypothetical protein